jgi:autotransporter-associated beta strand protein
VDDTAAFDDTNVVNGTAYYYVVNSTNPAGVSANSTEASATPSGSVAVPLIPTSIVAGATNNCVNLKWNASPGADRYIIRRTVLTVGAVTTYTPGGINPYSGINSYVTGTNYSDTALANNVVYSYTVSAANGTGQSAPSVAVNAMPTLSIPPTPTGLAASVISNQVTVSWSIVPSASSYIVQRATSSSGPFTTVDDPEPLTSFVDAGLNYNTTYYYRVAAASLGGISTNSPVIGITTTPPPPAPITAIPGNTQVFVDWGDSLGATNYVLMRSTANGGPYTTILSTTNTSYIDTGLINGTTYYYVAYATGTNGTSPLSAQTAGTPSANPQMIKSDTTNMDTSADWSGVAPDVSKIGLFNNIISAVNASAQSLGGDVAVGGLVFTNNMNGPVSVASGNTLTLGAGGLDMSRANQSVTFNNAIALGAQQIWNVTNSRTLTVNGPLTSASNTVIKAGGGTLALGVTSSDVGANIQVNAGTVQANASSGVLISLNGGTFNVNAFDSNPVNVMSDGIEQNIGGNRTWAGSLSGSGPLTVVASSVHTWSGNNFAYTGTLTLQGSGSLRLSSLVAVSATTAYNLNGGTLSANASGLFNLGSLSGIGTVNSGSGQNFSIGALGTSTTYSGVIAGAGFVVKDGTGTLIFNGANTYSGGTIVSNGVLQIGNGGTTGMLGSGTVTDLAMLAFSRSDSIDDTGFGTISGQGIVDKLGAGRLAFTKAQNYSGATLIESGILALTNSGAIPNSSSLSISSGALLDVSGAPPSAYLTGVSKTLSGNGSVKGNFVAGANWTLSPGMNDIGTLTFSNSLSLASGIQGCTNIFEISKLPLTNDVVKVAGALTNGGTLIVTNISTAALTNGDSFKLFDAASYNGAFTSVILPPLSAGLVWNTNSLNTNGTISIAALTSPTISAVQNAGSDLAVSGSGGTAGWPYVVLTTTNVGGPWVPIVTNYFDGGGNFSITLTNALNPIQPQSFYKLQLQ